MSTIIAPSLQPVMESCDMAMEREGDTGIWKNQDDAA